MKRTVQSWRLEDLDKQRGRITFPEFQREKQLWSVEKKRLLIDSIMRDIDIPKLYFYLNDKNEFEVIDGQQRLWAIWDYFGDQYAYEINEKPRTFSQLNGEQDTLKNYKLQITVIEEADEEYLREMFLRLQFGLLLNTGEKLHALSGAMKDYVFNELAQEPFITNLSIPNRRYARETLCAQICINSFRRAKVELFARTRYEDLRDFFIEYEHPTGKNLTFFRSQSKRITAALHGLWSCFQETTAGLRSRAYILCDISLVRRNRRPRRRVVIKRANSVFHVHIEIVGTAEAGDRRWFCQNKSRTLYVRDVSQQCVRGTISNRTATSETQTVFQSF